MLLRATVCTLLAYLKIKTYPRTWKGHELSIYTDLILSKNTTFCPSELQSLQWHHDSSCIEDVEVLPLVSGFFSWIIIILRPCYGIRVVAVLPLHQFWSEGNGCSLFNVTILKGFLNCTKTMVMLSHPSPPADGAKHLSITVSQIADSLFSCSNGGTINFYKLKCMSL